MELTYKKEKIEVWKTNPKVLNIQGEKTDFNDVEFVEKELIPKIMEKFGSNQITKSNMIEMKKSQIRKLRQEIGDIELSMMSCIGDYSINFFKHDEIPF